MLKMMIVGRRRGGMTVSQLQRYMIEIHGAAVVAGIALQPELMPRRYVQNHVFDCSFRLPNESSDPLTVARDFVTQVWFDSPAQAAAATQSQFYLEQLRPDEDCFVDQTSVVKLPVLAQEIFSTGRNRSRSKLFVLHRCAPDVAIDALAEVTLKLWKTLLADAQTCVDAVVRNRVLNRPGNSATVDLVDEIWLTDDEKTRSMGDRWQELAEAEVLRGLTVRGSTLVLLAHEHILFSSAA